MSQTGQRLEHVQLKVKDMGRAMDFYHNVMGLVEIARENNIVYLGCGYDENFDLAIMEGGTGIQHFAMRLDTEEQMEHYRQKLFKKGVKTEWHNGTEPGQEKGLRFHLPSGILMELVLVKDNRYLNPSRPAYRSNGMRPFNIDHINIMCNDVKKDTKFLQDILDYKISDIVEPEEGFWAFSFTRAKDYHHDIAFVVTKDEANTLHHIAWSMANFEHIKVACDILAQSGHKLEFGPGRHPIGPNLYAYFQEPGGNRFELIAEQSVLSAAAPTKIWNSMKDTLEEWSDVTPPASFLKGS